MMVILYAISMKLLHTPLLHSPVGLILLRYLADSYGYRVVQSIQTAHQGTRNLNHCLFVNRTDSLIVYLKSCAVCVILNRTFYTIKHRNMSRCWFPISKSRYWLHGRR